MKYFAIFVTLALSWASLAIASSISDRTPRRNRGGGGGGSSGVGKPRPVPPIQGGIVKPKVVPGVQGKPLKPKLMGTDPELH